MKPLHLSSLILCVALLGCLLPLPYGYYILVRFGTMIVAMCWAYEFLKMEAMTLTVIAGAIAVLFQPFFKIALDRLTWNIIDVSIVMCLLYLIWKYRHTK
jgi:hypothetical protein